VITYEFETVGQCFDEIVRLGVDHDEEVNWAPDLYVLNPSWEMYHALESEGALDCLVARDKGAVVGYIVAVTGPHINYQDLRVGTILTVFARRDVRAAGVAYRLFRKMADRLESGGADVIHVYVPTINPPPARLLDKLGFRKVEEKYECVNRQRR